MSIALAALLALSAAAPAAPSAPTSPPPIDNAADARRMLADLVAYQSVAGHRDLMAIADHLAKTFRAAGFNAADVQVHREEAAPALTVRFRGRDGALPPVLFLAHMDVVPANAAEWKSNPWTLTERDGKLIGRGVGDNKYGLMSLTRAFLRLKREGHVPARDLVLVVTGDEETTMATTRRLAERFKGAAFAVNSDAGGGFVPSDGPLQYALQTMEKTYVTFEVTARNRGGHSSRPRPDNAIYELADALKRIATHRFPVRWNEATLADLAGTAAANDDEVGQAAARFVAHPGDPDALAVLQREPWIDSTLRTTCVATRLRAGDADNALATQATATVNCRVFPGETIAQTQAALQAAVGQPAIEVNLLNAQGDSPVLATPGAAVQALERVLAVRAPGMQVIPFMSAGATDSLHFRRAGIPTVGMGPLLATEDTSYRYHGIDENVPVAEFAGGLEHYYRFIKALDAVERPVDAAAR